MPAKFKFDPLSSSGNPAPPDYFSSVETSDDDVIDGGQGMEVEEGGRANQFHQTEFIDGFSKPKSYATGSKSAYLRHSFPLIKFRKL